MKKRIGIVGILFCSCIVFAIISGVITFFVTSDKEKKVEMAAENSRVEPVIQKEENVENMADIFDGVENVYLENYLGGKDLIEVDREEIGHIIARLKAIDLELLAIDTEELSDYFYGLHIKNKNLKIKISDKYIAIDDVQGGIKIFETQEKGLKELNRDLEAIYMKKYNIHELFKNPKNVYVMAKDVEKQWELDEKEMKELLKKIQLKAIIDGKTMIGIPRTYPDYAIKIMTNNKDYGIHLVNEGVLALDTSDSYVYYQYDKKLWEYIMKNYSVRPEDEKDELKDLLKADKIVVDDQEDEFDFEDDTYYHIEIARWIIKAPKKLVNEVQRHDSLMFVLSFTIEGEVREVKIYKNQIHYNEKIYYSEKIGETIKSVLSIQ